MKKKLTQKEIDRRFAEINARVPECLTEEESASLSAARAMDDGTSVSLREFLAMQPEYSFEGSVKNPYVKP